MSFEVHTVSLALANAIGASDSSFYVLPAPSDAEGGGITVIGGYVTSDATLAAGTVNYYSLALHKYSNAATPVLNGTIAAAVGGTAGWTGGVPKAFTIDEDYQFVDAGEWVVAEYTEAGTGNPTDGVVVIQYVMGK